MAKHVAQHELDRTPPAPRSLRTIKGARNELCRLYRELRLGKVDPQVAGRAAHILSLLIRSGTDFELEERVKRLEDQFAAPRPNGRAAPPP
jgi:hypothetical protein